MRGDFKIISLVFLLLIFFISQVSAYDSFFIIKEDKDSSKALLIYNIDPTLLMNQYDTILTLTRNEGDFSDLIMYLKSSKIMNIVYYSNDDINNDIIQSIKIGAGVSFRKLNEKDVVKLNVTTLENTSENKEANPIVTGDVVSGNTDTTRFLLIFSIIITLAVIVVLMILIPGKKGKLKKK